MICLKCGQDSPGNYCSNCGAQLYGNRESENHDFPDFNTQDSELYNETHNGSYSELHRKINSNEAGNYQNNAASPQPERHNGARREKRNEPKKRSRAKQESGSRGGQDKQIKKEIKQRDIRIRRLEDDLDELNRNERKRSRRARQEQDSEGNNGQELRDAAVKSAVGVTVLCTRLMQLASFFLMAYMVWIMQHSFLSDGESLGNVYTMLEERNYALAIYVVIAGFVLFFGVIWCLWILSKKDAGGNTRLKKYDTGRGFIPFLICVAVLVLIPYALAQLPASEQIVGVQGLPVSAESWQALAEGTKAALTAIDSQRSVLILCSLSGAALSFARKLLRV